MNYERSQAVGVVKWRVVHGVDFYHNRVDVLASGWFFSTKSILQTIESNVAQIESIIITIEQILSRIE